MSNSPCLHENYAPCTKILSAISSYFNVFLNITYHVNVQHIQTKYLFGIHLLTSFYAQGTMCFTLQFIPNVLLKHYEKIFNLLLTYISRKAINVLPTASPIKSQHPIAKYHLCADYNHAIFPFLYHMLEQGKISQ